MDAAFQPHSHALGVSKHAIKNLFHHQQHVNGFSRAFPDDVCAMEEEIVPAATISTGK
jgi:hypothetical protein